MKNNKNTMNITLKRALSSLAVAFAIAPAFAQRDTVNVIDWQFSRSTLTPATATQGDGIWKAVRLPHDFLVEQPWVAPAKDEKADNSDLAANVKSRLSARFQGNGYRLVPSHIHS